MRLMVPRWSDLVSACFAGPAAAFSLAQLAGCGINVLTVGYERAAAARDADADRSGSSNGDAADRPQGATGGSEGHEPRPDAVADRSVSDAVGDEDAGTPPPDASEALADSGLEADACVPNACGGCGPLEGNFDGGCGECGKYTCGANGASLFCDDPGVVSQISAGHDHTCALIGAGRVRCWGWNNVGQLGNGTTSQLGRLAPPPTDLLTGVRLIAAGADHTCILTDAGGLRCWGGNTFGQLGSGSTGIQVTPPDTDVLTGVRGLAIGQFHTCAILDSSGLRCWGAALLPDGIGTDWTVVPPSEDVLKGVRAVAAGQLFTCALLDTEGVRCWGDNEFGQLGDGTTMTRTTPPPTDVLAGVTALSAGVHHVCALLRTGGVRCWGDNEAGQLGDGTLTNRSTPPSVDVIGGVTALSAGALHTCVLLQNGGVRCWGDNHGGQLGDGTIINRSTPTPADAIAGAIGISCGFSHTCALLGTHRVQCWGSDNWGQLGDGAGVTRSTPAPLATLCP